MHGRSSSQHHPTLEFQPPKDVSKPPSLLDFPIQNTIRVGSLGTEPRQAKVDFGKNKIPEISTMEVITETKVVETINDTENLQCRSDESWEEYGSRLAVEELDRFVKFVEPRTSIEVEKLKELQVIEIENQKHIIMKEDIVYPNDEDDLIEYCSTTYLLYQSTRKLL